MRAWANQNVRVKKPVYHFGVSLAPDEHLSREQWEHVVDRMLERLGLAEHQAFIALHRDRAHEHIHIAVNRVGPDQRVWKPRYDVFKQQDAARELERELGLRVVPTRRDLRLEQRRANGVKVDNIDLPEPPCDPKNTGSRVKYRFEIFAPGRPQGDNFQAFNGNGAALFNIPFTGKYRYVEISSCQA